VASTANENAPIRMLDAPRADAEESEPARMSVATDVGLSWSDPRWLSDPDELEERCRAYLEELRWPEGIQCPRCESRECGRIVARKKFYCRSCRYHFSVTAGTVFHNSHLPVWKWFLTVSVMLDSESGVPSNQLVRLLGGSYKTAWFAQHRVRAAIEESAGDDDRCTDEGARRARDAAADRLLETNGRDTRLFDRPIVGPYHQIGAKYVRAYLAEIDWRSRCRHNPRAFRDTVLRLLECDPLAYTDLIARRSAPVARATPRRRSGAQQARTRVRAGT
jgi:transposase-like protein